MTSFPSGPLPNPLLLPDAKDTSPGSQLCALTHGDAMIGIIDSVASAKTVGFCYGTLMWECYTGLKR
jgi:hypothetical protein